MTEETLEFNRLAKDDWKACLGILLIGVLFMGAGLTGFYGLGPVGEDRTHISEVGKSAVDMSSVVSYEELSSAEQQMFRQEVPHGGVTGAEGEWENEPYIELDGEYFETENRHTVGGLWSIVSLISIGFGVILILLISTLIIGSSILSGVEFLSERRPLLLVLLKFIFVGAIVAGLVTIVVGMCFVIVWWGGLSGYNAVVVSELPVEIDESEVADEDVLEIVTVPSSPSESSFESTRGSIESVFVGGDAVEKSETDYSEVWSVEDDRRAEESLLEYEYVQTDGELYPIGVEYVEPGPRGGSVGWTVTLVLVTGWVWIVCLAIPRDIYLEWKMINTSAKK